MEINVRKNLRYGAYDYASSGAYFVTLCTQHRRCLFGAIARDEMVLNEVGQLVKESWSRLPTMFSHIVIDSFVVMPNHFHAILHLSPRIVGDSRVGSEQEGHVEGPLESSDEMNDGPSRPTLGKVIGAFKSSMTVELIKNVKHHGWHPFDKRIWQRNYYEHIIRDEASLVATRKYIANNPKQWAIDKENPDAFV